MFTENIALDVYKLAGREGLPGIAFDEIPIVPVHDEADVLRIMLPGVNKSVLLRKLPHLLFR